MKVSWDRFDGVEAQVFEPDAGANKVILFCPGFPGMGGTVFEQRHAAALVEEGYAVYKSEAQRHKAFRRDGTCPCEQRRASGAGTQNSRSPYRRRTRHDYGLDDGAVQSIARSECVYESIHVIGNSFGALAALWSLTEEGAPVSKVKSLLLYAGAQGMDDGEYGIMRIWKPEYLMVARITDKVTLNDPFDVVKRSAMHTAFCPSA